MLLTYVGLQTFLMSKQWDKLHLAPSQSAHVHTYALHITIDYCTTLLNALALRAPVPRVSGQAGRRGQLYCTVLSDIESYKNWQSTGTMDRDRLLRLTPFVLVLACAITVLNPLASLDLSCLLLGTRLWCPGGLYYSTNSEQAYVTVVYWHAKALWRL